MTKEQLKSIPRIEKSIKRKKRQLLEIREIMYCVPALSNDEKVQMSVVNRGMSVVDSALDLEQKLHEDCVKLLNLKNEAYDIIRDIKDDRERELMELRYIDGLRWEKIALEMNYSHRWVTRLHGRILAKLFPND